MRKKYAQEWLVGDKMKFIKIYLDNTDFSVEDALDAAVYRLRKKELKLSHI